MIQANKSNQVRVGVEILATLEYKSLKLESKTKCTTKHTIAYHLNINARAVNR